MDKKMKIIQSEIIKIAPPSPEEQCLNTDNHSLFRKKFKQTHFKYCIFTGSVEDGNSIFEDCIFEKCSFVDFYIHEFTKCHFYDSIFKDSSTHKSHWNQFYPSFFRGCNFKEVQFIKCSLDHLELEESIFKNVRFVECRINSLDLEFRECTISDIDGLYLDNCILSYSVSTEDVNVCKVIVALNAINKEK